MSIPATIRHQGALAGTQSPGGPSSSLTDVMNTSWVQTVGGSKGVRVLLQGTDQSPAVIPFEVATRVTLLSVCARGGGGKLLITWAGGTAQALPLGATATFVWQDPTPGNELTAVAFVGQADVEYVLGG